jgi:hypothetical protein
MSLLRQICGLFLFENKGLHLKMLLKPAKNKAF